MGARGRKASADFDTATGEGTMLEPPSTLMKDQRDLWLLVVATKPPEWFSDDSAPVLEAYVKAVSHYRAMAKRLDTPPVELPALDQLSRIVAQQARLVAQLAAKMRLTQQSRFTPLSAMRRHRDVPTSKPWED